MSKVVVAVLIAVLLVGAVSTGFCQYNYVGLTSDAVTARWMGMGGAGTAAADDEGAIDFNPALLPGLDLGAASETFGLMAVKGSLTVSAGEYDSFSARVAAVDANGVWGAALGYEHASDGWIDDILQVGVGYKLPNTGLALGAQMHDWNGESMLHLGAAYDLPALSVPVRLGAVWGNLTNTDYTDSWLNLGLSAKPVPGLRVAVDVFDVTDNLWKTFWAFGAEYQLPEGIALRAGAQDGDFAFGAGYKREAWSVDAAFSSFWDDNQFTLTGGMSF